MLRHNTLTLLCVYLGLAELGLVLMYFRFLRLFIVRSIEAMVIYILTIDKGEMLFTETTDSNARPILTCSMTHSELLGSLVTT